MINPANNSFDENTPSITYFSCPSCSAYSILFAPAVAGTAASCVECHGRLDLGEPTFFCAAHGAFENEAQWSALHPAEATEEAPEVCAACTTVILDGGYEAPSGHWYHDLECYRSHAALFGRAV